MADITVVSSGGFKAALLALLPEFERTSGHKVVAAWGSSVAGVPSSIPNRLDRGEPVDVVILAADALDHLIRQGLLVPDSRVDLARSGIGITVREGAAIPDVRSAEDLRRVLLAARSIGHSASASGIYLVGLFERLGIANAIRARTKRVEGEPVGAVVARGEIEIGFQQISELLPVPGIHLVGPLPDEIQQFTTFSAGIAAGAPQPDAGRTLVAFLSAPAADRAIKGAGMVPARAA